MTSSSPIRFHSILHWHSLSLCSSTVYNVQYYLMKWTIQRAAIYSLFTIYLPDISFCSLFFNIFIEKLTRCPADNVDVTFSMSSFLFFFWINNSIDKCKNFFEYKIDCDRGLVHFIDRTLSKIDVVGPLFKEKNWKKKSAAPWSVWLRFCYSHPKYFC